MTGQISELKGLLQIGCACIWCLFSAGIIFGFAAFKQVLINEGVYSEYCKVGELLHLDDNNIIPCTAQDLKLNYMFSISAAITNILALPVGWVLDYYGPQMSGLIGSGILYIGAFNFIMAKNLVSSYYDPYLVGYVLLAVGGPFGFISSFHLSNIFPSRSGTVMALITGCFDSSSALFLVYRVIYEGSYKVSLKEFFSIYLLVPTFIVVAQLFFMPKNSYQSLKKNLIDEVDESLGNSPPEIDQETTPLINEHTTEATNSSIETRRQPLRRRSSSVTIMVENRSHHITHAFDKIHKYSVREQISSPWFYLLLIFAAVCMLRINYFLATIRSQETYLLGDEEAAVRLNKIFDLLLPIGGVVVIPFVGYILDNINLLHIVEILSYTSLLIGVLGLIPNSYNLNLFGIVLLVMYRPFYYTVVSDYTSKIFGFTSFGIVYGLLTSICGVFTMIQSHLDDLTHTTFEMNPAPVNIILVSLTALSACALIIYMHSQKLNS